MKSGIYPAPIYEAHFADGTIGRCSFWSAAGKPINFAYGKRAVAAVFARPECQVWRPKPTVRLYAGNGEEPAIYTPIERADDPATFWTITAPRADIVRGFVEHESIGRIEDSDAARASLAKPRKPAAGDPRLREIALKIAREFDGVPNSARLWSHVAALRAELGMPAIGGAL